jgi:2-haloacid dehalogenase
MVGRMPPRPSEARAVVFDAYGTLFDVHSAVSRHAGLIGPDAGRLSELWRAKQLEYTWVLSLAGRYESFRGLTQKALDYALARCPSVDPALAGRLLQAYRVLDAYPEVAGVLAELRERGLRTGILSNGDRGMLEEAIRSAKIDGLLDVVISAESAGIFKSSPRVYELAVSMVGMPAKEIVFASSNRWDIAGAVAFGLPSVWVNRAGLPDEYAGLRPLATVRDLAGIGAVLAR